MWLQEISVSAPRRGPGDRTDALLVDAHGSVQRGSLKADEELAGTGVGITPVGTPDRADTVTARSGAGKACDYPY